MTTCCLIGSRGHVYYVFESLSRLPELKITGISSGSEDSVDRLKNMTEKHNMQPEIFADWKIMLQTLKPDIAVVDGPFDKHAEMAIFALQNGSHVFCEKPMAFNKNDLQKLRNAWKASGKHILSMVGLRYNTVFQHALNLVRGGAVGKVKMVRAQKSYRLGERPEFYKKRATYGGTIPWVGSHAFDWILAFSGSDFESVYATQDSTDNFGNGELEIACQCMGVMKNGVQYMASIDFLRPAAAPSHGDDRVRVAGTEGVIEAAKDKIIIIDKDGEREIAVPPPQRYMFADFVHSISSGEKCYVSEEETFALAEITIAAQESADNGKIIYLK